MRASLAWQGSGFACAPSLTVGELCSTLPARVMDELYPLVLRLIHLLQKALPDADPRDLFWSFQFTSGAYTLILLCRSLMVGQGPEILFGWYLAATGVAMAIASVQLCPGRSGMLDG